MPTLTYPTEETFLKGVKDDEIKNVFEAIMLGPEDGQATIQYSYVFLVASHPFVAQYSEEVAPDAPVYDPATADAFSAKVNGRLKHFRDVFAADSVAVKTGSLSG